MQKSHIVTLIASACLAGCGPDVEAIPEVSAQMATDMGVEKAQLQRGRDLYMAHCHQCHERVKPAKIDPEYWREILPHMSQNARLNAAQLRDLQTYLIAAHGAVYHLD